MIKAKRLHGKGVRQFKSNPARRDCIAWTEKSTGKLIFRDDYEREHYTNYCNAQQEQHNEVRMTKTEYCNDILWGN